MPNTDERRAKKLLVEQGKFQEKKWNDFLKCGPHFGSPKEIAQKFLDFS